MTWKAVFENPTTGEGRSRQSPGHTSDEKMEKAKLVYGRMRAAAEARDWNRVVEIWRDMPRGSFLKLESPAFRTLAGKARRLQEFAYEAGRVDLSGIAAPRRRLGQRR